MRAIEDDTEALTSGDDNLRTLQLVFAAYRSMEQGRAVSPKEVIA
jgi:predicted dehydrogenase